MKKYIAYDPLACEFEIFNDFEKAKEWLLEGDWSDEGFPEEFVDGDYLIAEVTHVSAVKITDKRENYKCVKEDGPAHCSDCEDLNCEDGEEWPYDDLFDWVGEPQVKAVDENAYLITTAPELLEDLESRYAQTRCGCGHPACNRCEDDRETERVLRKAKRE